MEPRKRLWLAICLVLFFLGMGTAGYVFLERYSLIEAFYMTVITISTVGFGEIVPLSESGRIFTVFLILSGVGSIAFAASAFTEIILERAANPNRWIKTMEKRINKLNGHVVICGHGRVGAAAADFLNKEGAEFVIIENSEESAKEISELGYCYILGDGTREDVLGKAGIKKASSLLAVLDSDPDNLFAVLTAREMNPVLRIIARIEQPSSESRILRAGADSVISPFVAAGKRVAESLLGRADFTMDIGAESVQKESVLSWTEVTDELALAGQSQAEVSAVIDGSIIGIRRGDKDLMMPDATELVRNGDQLLVMTKSRSSLETVTKTVMKKIVLVDDNPVILRLYTRLFQKAGFNILSAPNGELGYAMILRESPDVAIIDYRLPDMSGLSVCKNIRGNKENDNVKLILFTADDRENIRLKALDSGVDHVVVKSPDAGEIVSLVTNVLNLS